MGAVKVTAADTAFSWCIRERAGWRCERCGTQYQPPTQALHCSHYHGRGKWSVRFDPDNAIAACYGCHRILGSQPDEHRRLFEARLGPGGYEILLEKANNLSLGRRAKREKKEIAAHYRRQLYLMEGRRDTAVHGQLVSYF